MWRLIVNRSPTDVAAPTTREPPRVSVSRIPSPAESVVVVPITAGVRQIAPGLARDPYIAELWSPYPVAAAIGVPVASGRLVGRPNIALTGNVIPVAARVEVSPCGITAVGFVSAGRSASGL